MVRPQRSVYFITIFVDGREVETANSTHVRLFPPVAGHDYRQFPEAEDPGLLYEIHRLRTAPSGSDRRDFPAVGEEVAYLTRKMTEFYLQHVETGYLQEVEPGELFAPTIKGAFLMTWKLLPPMSWIARWRRWEDNRAFLAENHLLKD
jgi:hypothetical protein